MEYNFRDIEPKWQKYWKTNKTFKADIKDKPKYYVLDMFPYPSGAGLHVGHPLGYIASDIFSRYKRLKGFNVLHPMGFDAFGLPAEQYAIQTGQHPAITTQKNIQRYKEQLDLIGLSYDWDREVRTCDPKYYKWTQWTFIKLFNSYYNYDTNKAEPIDELLMSFEAKGTEGLNIACSKKLSFTAQMWDKYSKKEKSDILMNYRLAYLSDSMVNWCSALGTVLANDEVVNGTSVRGGYPVERKAMKQWSLRITAYADRLLEGLNKLDWSESIKEVQRYWIGKSRGCLINFSLAKSDDTLAVFTTRPDTIFGVTFMVISPEHPLVNKIVTPNYKAEVKRYVDMAKHKSELERTGDTKTVSGIFTGAYAVNPFTQKQIPIYISDYVLMGYGTGAIMAVPAHDQRDFLFAKKFMLPIIQVVSSSASDQTNTYTWKQALDSKEGTLLNSQFLNNLEVKDAITRAISYVERHNLGYGTTNYRLRDAIFSRQRYWGEPFPIYYDEQGIPDTLDESELPLELPEVDKFLPTPDGQPPLARAKDWTTVDGYRLETNTMPGFAGSNAYSIRYMDPHNNDALCSTEANDYWQNVDLYVGGSEHATGHLLYSRFITKFLFDLGYICKDEPYQRLVNQGMIQGKSCLIYRVKGENKYVSYNLKNDVEVDPIHIDISLVDANNVVDIDRLRQWRQEFKDAQFVLEDGKYICGNEVEKMSKSLYNVINPDALIEKYGADVLRLYEMFLGPIEQSKPWDVQGIEGVSRFMKKFWKLYVDEQGLCLTDEKADKEELKILHRTIKKVEDDIERFSLNTCVSNFMIITNELTEHKCHKREILEPLCILISPFAPHVAEELWSMMGHEESISYADFPQFDQSLLEDTDYNYPVSINGKTRTFALYPLDKDVKQIEQEVVNIPELQSHLQGKTIVKVIFVKHKIINIVVK